jgi:hypothetical protein
MVARLLVNQLFMRSRGGERVLGFRMWRMHHEHTLND